MGATKEKYVVLAPSTIYSGRKYKVALHVQDVAEKCELKVNIKGPSYDEAKTVEINDNALQFIEFDVPVVEEGDYIIRVEGVDGIACQRTERLGYDRRGPVISIQMDKYVYKPGDTINYRVLFLDDDLLPYENPRGATILLEDAKQNVVKKLTDIDIRRGVHTGKLELSEFLAMGHWRLNVECDGRNDNAYFKVEKYVLPKYEVKIESTNDVAVQDGEMQVVVRANYTYDKPFNGKVTLVMKLETGFLCFRGNDDDEATPKEVKAPPTMIRTAEMINGKCKFDLNVKEYEEFMPQKHTRYYLDINADVEENFTETKLNARTSTNLYPHRYFMRPKDCFGCYSFKADQEAEVRMEVTHVDGTPVKDTNGLLKLIYTEVIKKNYYGFYACTDSAEGSRSDKEAEDKPPLDRELRNLEFESRLDDKAEAVFKVTLPALEEVENYTHYYKVYAEYADEKQVAFQTYQYREPKEQPNPEVRKVKDLAVENAYEKDTYNFKIGQEAKFTIKSRTPLSHCAYVVVARSNIFSGERLELPDQPTSHELKFPTEFAMIPLSCLYVYYVDDQGEFHFAETTFSVEPQLRNEIQISTAKEAKPGEEVSLNVKTAPNSFVGLLAVDQSVLMLGDNNDYSGDNFRWRIGGHYGNYYPWLGARRSQPGLCSGVVTITNGIWRKQEDELQQGVGCTFGAAANGRSGTTEMCMTKGAPALMADSTTSREIAQTESVPIRKNFVETWIFDDIESTESEEFSWTKKIPDTITSWLISGFSLHPQKGIAVTKERSKIVTFQPFFVSIRLPYSVKRGEVIKIPALVFNYLEEDLDVEVCLENADGEYEFVDGSNETIDEEKIVQAIKVSSNSSMGASFMLRPRVIGSIMLKFTASSCIAADAVHKTLKVVPEGVTEYANKVFYVNLRDAPELRETFALELPEDTVPDSQHVELGVVGDLLGPLVKNFDRLIRLPMGCAEQTVSKMLPSYFALRYLQSIDKLGAFQETKIRRNLETGYQHILTYRHDEGSFSIFGPGARSDGKPHNGSTWLTAYVLRSLHEVKELVNVDEKIIKEGLDYLAKRQAENGSFADEGDFYYSGQRNEITLAANVVRAFVENSALVGDYQDQIDKAFQYIVANFDNCDNLLAKAVAVYTMKKANFEPEKTAELVAQLKDLAKTDGERMWWSEREKKAGRRWWCFMYSNDVEITSYMLLTLLDTETETVESVLPIVRWLVTQRNSYGGFISTQDTMVGLRALVSFASKCQYEAATMSVTVNGGGGDTAEQTIEINDENAILLQNVELPPKTESVEFTATGTGVALVQIAYQYNVAEKEKEPSFLVEATVSENSIPAKVEINVSVEYVGEGDASGMAILEVSLPSGYTANVDAFEAVSAVEGVRLTETKNSETVIVVYFERLRKGEARNLAVEASKAFAVALQKPSPVVLYDYYDTTKKATTFYEIPSNLSDLGEI